MTLVPIWQYLIYLILAHAMFSCSDAGKGKDNKPDPGTSRGHMERKSPVSGTYCFVLNHERDTAFFTFQLKDSNVQGRLIYKLWEKDANSGWVNATFKDDEIKGWYRFQSEGLWSTREVSFRWTQGLLLEGSGPVFVRSDTQFFASGKSLRFGTIRFKQIPCRDTLSKKRVLPDTSTRPLQSDTPRLRLGKYALTLHWIGWDYPGSARIKPSDEGWYFIEGTHYSKDRKDSLFLEGIIRPLSKEELLFRGKIITRVQRINGGEPCVRTGEQRFLSTRNRKYWRLQNMINCEGGLVTDYIDLYF